MENIASIAAAKMIESIQKFHRNQRALEKEKLDWYRAGFEVIERLKTSGFNPIHLTFTNH